VGVMSTSPESGGGFKRQVPRRPARPAYERRRYHCHAWNLGDQTVREIGDDLAFEIPAQLWVNDCENQVGE